MNLRGKKVGILGGTRISCEIVRAARELGMRTAVLDYYPPEESPAKQIADEHAQVSVADARQVAAYAREHGVDGLITGYTDSILGMYADACVAAGLPCYGDRALFELFTDKARWKELCVEYGVPTAARVDLGSTELERRLPILVKPVDGSGSRGVGVVHNMCELAAAIDRAASFSKTGEVIAEEYLEGPEATVFWVFAGGRYEVYMMGDRVVKPVPGAEVPLPVGYLFPSAAMPRYLEEVAPRVREMLAAAGVENGMMFMQCVVRDGLPRVYDIGYRLTGSLEHHLAKAAAGFSPMDMLLNFAVGGRMTDDSGIFRKVEAARYAPAVNISVLMRPGAIGRFEGLDEARAVPGVVAVVPAHAEGEILPEEAVGELRQIAVRVLGVGESAADLERIALEVQNAVRVVSDDGEDLTLPGLAPGDFRSFEGGGRG